MEIEEENIREERQSRENEVKWLLDNEIKYCIKQVESLLENTIFYLNNSAWYKNKKSDDNNKKDKKEKGDNNNNDDNDKNDNNDKDNNNKNDNESNQQKHNQQQQNNIKNKVIQIRKKLNQMPKAPKTLIDFQQQKGEISGFLQVNGWSVTSAEINIKSSKHKINYVTKIHDFNPLCLKELQDSYNYTIETLEELATINTSSIRLKQLHEILIHSCALISKARDELLYQKVSKSFIIQEILSTGQTNFQPLPPNNLLLHVGVCNHEFFVRAYILNISSNQKNLSIGPNTIGHLFKYKNQYAKVVEELEVTKESKVISTCYKNLSQSSEIISDMIDKVLAVGL